MASYLSLILSLTFLPTIFSDPSADREALLRLQAALKGRTLLWNTSIATPCSWRGVNCDNTTNRVTHLRLPSNGLRGQLPLNTIGNMTGLRVLSLRGNSISGQLPSDLASCTLLQEIHLQGNRFSGEIPASFFTLRNLLRVNLAGNNFSGNLPLGFSNLTNLTTLYLENNHFTGPLPDWNALNQLRNFNVSFNEITGNIPSSLSRFPSHSFLATSLCGNPLPSCSSNNGNKLSGGAIAGITVGSFLSLLLILTILFISLKTYHRRKILPRSDRSPVPPSPATPLKRETQNRNQLVKLTNQDNLSSEVHRRTIKNGGGDGLVFFGHDVEVFGLEELLTSPAEVIGKGVVGSTYKAYFESGVAVIVKRLKNVCVNEEEFRVKIEEVGVLVHQNLEPLRGYFYGGDEKLLIYDPMPNGSLSALLHCHENNNSNNNNSQRLSWKIRARIALGTSSAVEYLHSISPTTTHGNLKSSNIFLTNYYDVRVSEFCLTRLVYSSTSLNGYKAPEVMDTRTTTQHADVYSFGVVLLELLTGREPDSVLKEEGVELPTWARSVVGEKGVVGVFDADLVRFGNAEEQMVQLLHLAVSCSSLRHEMRPSMVEVRRRIEEICG